ncbi:MAG: heparinase II/III family protein [Armatimonadota bacterium]
MKITGLFTLIAVPALASLAHGGPLFDDYLNYNRLGERCSFQGEQIVSSADKPTGQSFKLTGSIGEIYRIGVYANPDEPSWSKGESVTMTLYESLAKAQKLGSYTIPWETNRMAKLRKSNDDRERLLLFHLRAKDLPKGATSLYFELVPSGGDGKVSFYYRPTGGYDGGQGYLGGQPQTWDLSFESHIKPVMDRIANLRTFWGERVNLDLPALAEVKKAVQAEDWDKAEEEFVKHFHGRMDLYKEYQDLFVPKPDPKFDLTTAENFLKGLISSERGENAWMLWRKESYWGPDYPLPYGKFTSPEIYTWGIDRMLGSAYASTADEKYARAAVDYRMQWILDNTPSVTITGIDVPHDVWSELRTQGRAAGHGVLAYSRLYNYKGWTTDERMLFFSSWYDNALYLYKNMIGGNWGSQTTESLRKFGMDFPEYKLAPDFVSWASGRNVELALSTVRHDGTNQEAAIKYHAMIARRLKSLMEDVRDGKLKADALDKPGMMRTLDGMYDHMAYTLQPNNYVVMYGDAWYENYSEEVADAAKKLLKRPDLLYIATQGKEGRPPAQDSKGYLEGGLFSMRSSFADKPFTDARQVFVHNGGWTGSHGHPDLTAINLFAYGRTLLIDPAGMWNPPGGGAPYYHKSDVHSMLTANGWDTTRDPGPNKWITANGIDYLDAVHYGYRKNGIPEVRRRIVFVKPNYYVVKDTAVAENAVDWSQNWNILAKDVKIDPVSKVVETSYPTGGNLIIAPANTAVSTKTRKANVPMDGLQDTSIVSFNESGKSADYTTVLYPYKGVRPVVQVAQVAVDVPGSSSAVRIANGKDVGFVAFSGGAGAARFGGGKHALNGEILIVRTTVGSSLKGFSWYNATGASFNGKALAKSANAVALLDVAYSVGKVVIQAKEEEPSLSVFVGQAKSVMVNGRKAQPKDGWVKPFAAATTSIIVDDQSAGFRKITEGNEWETVSEAGGYNMGYTAHETDPGRNEAAAYSAIIAKAGLYTVSAYIPASKRTLSDRMEFALKDGMIVTVDQQQSQGKWVKIGIADLAAGRQEFLTVTNRTKIDGIYPVWDAVRLVAQQ